MRNKKRMYIKIGDNKYRKNDTRDPIGGHKGQVYPAKVIRFYQDMLVDQHAHKD